MVDHDNRLCEYVKSRQTDNLGVAKTSKPVPGVAYYAEGGVRYRGFQLDGEMHGVVRQSRQWRP